MIKSYQYRIYPNIAQKQKIEQTFGVCRLIYNLALQVKSESYKANGTNLSYFELNHQLTLLKQDYSWMNDVDSQAVQYSIRKLDVAFRNFFKGKGYPKFKSKKGRQSFQCPNNRREVDFKKGLLSIPKIKNIPIIITKTFIGEIKTISIIRVPTGKYFATILADDKVLPPTKNTPKEDTSIGIDLGIKHFAVLSNEKKIDNPRFLRNSFFKLKKLQVKLSHKSKGSKNKNKARLKVALQHEKITNQRNDFLHKLSSAIIKQYDSVCIEDLYVSGMAKNRKLSKSIYDLGWGEFVRQLKYKAEWTGKNALEVPRFFASSKTCNKCGSKNEALTLAEREWTCANCGTLHDRDISAARNIKDYFFKTDGQSGLACGVNNNSYNYEAGNIQSDRKPSTIEEQLNQKQNSIV